MRERGDGRSKWHTPMRRRRPVPAVFHPPGIDTSPTTLIWLSSGVMASLTARATGSRVASQRVAPRASSFSTRSAPGGWGRALPGWAAGGWILMSFVGLCWGEAPARVHHPSPVPARLYAARYTHRSLPRPHCRNAANGEGPALAAMSKGCKGRWRRHNQKGTGLYGCVWVCLGSGWRRRSPSGCSRDSNSTHQMRAPQ